MEKELPKGPTELLLELFLGPNKDKYKKFLGQNNAELRRLHRERRGENLTNPPRPTYE